VASQDGGEDAEDRPMTAAQATRVLSGPLKFGDQKQIEAVLALREKSLCPECKGTGMVDCDDLFCPLLRWQ